MKQTRRMIRLWISATWFPVFMFVVYSLACLAGAVTVFLLVMKAQNHYS